MEKILYGLISLLLMGSCTLVFAEPYRYSLCDKPGITCMQVQEGDSWGSLFSNDEERDIVMRLNRMNIYLRPGSLIAIPEDLAVIDKMDISPFAYHIHSPGRRVIIIDPKRLAWGAYDASGCLVNWGPISAGRAYCPDTHRRGKTPIGTFSVCSKHGVGCVSKKFPIGRGGAPMPYCMFFRGGYAMHGSSFLPGFNASHGCVRLFTSDARWLNQSFATVGTKVIVYNY